MPKAVEDCVKKIHGDNPRTRKPYTEQEKWAICQAAHNKKKGKAEQEVEITEEEISLAAEELDRKIDMCRQRMMKSGRAKDMEEAHQLCRREMAKANYDLNKFEFFLDLDLMR